MKIKLTLLTILLLMLACQRQKQPFFVQNPILQANIKVQTNAFAKSIDAHQYEDVIEKGEKFLIQYKDSLSYDSTGWAMLHHRLGVAYSRATPQDSIFRKKMKTHFETAIDLRTLIPTASTDLANSYLNLGIGENKHHKHEDAIAPLKKAFDFYSEKETVKYIGVRKELLLAYINEEEYELAEQYFQSIKSFYSSLKEETKNDNVKLEYAGSLRYYGDLLKAKGNYQEAIKYYNDALKLYTKENDVMTLNLNRSFALMENKQNAEAISTVNSTITYFLKQEDSVNLGQAYFQLGNCYIAQKNYAQALFFSKQKALPILQNQQDRVAIGACYFTSALAYDGKGDNQKALQNSQKSLQSYLFDFKSDDIKVNPSEEQIIRCQVKPELIDVLELKAKALTKLATQSKSITYLESAWQTYQTRSDLQALVREDIPSENSKIALGEKQNWVSAALNVAKQLYVQTKDFKYQEQAYALVQNSKAAVIIEYLQGEKGKKIANVSKADSAQDVQFSVECYKLYKAKSDSPDDKNIDNQILLSEERFNSFKKEIEQKYPLYYQYKYNHKALEIKEIQARLRPNMATLDYMATADSLHIFCINKQRLTWKTISLDGSQKANADTLKKLLNDPNGEMKTPQSKQFLDCSHRLYQCLIEPMSSELLGIIRLRIIPSDWLHKVAFESLCTTPYSGDWSNINVPYLIRDKAMSYLFSVKELQPIATKKTNNKISVGSFGISYDDKKMFSSSRSSDSCLNILAATRGGGKLHHAVEEADAVYALWGVGDCLLNEKATKNNFIKNCQSNDYSILHLAMHGVPECSDPQKIQLVFAKNNATEDNLMHLHEIAGLKMHSNLAVLSACHSGDGQLENQEGIISLTRAFAMAGCRSLITSNSYVNDYTSPMIFNYFYKNLKDDELDKDIALQKAICKYLDYKSDDMRLPYRWANFHLWGDVDQIQGSEDTTFPTFGRLLLLVGITIIAFIGVISFRRGRTQNAS